MAILVNIPHAMQEVAKKGYAAGCAGQLSKVPKEFKDSPFCDAWIVGWLAGKNGWDMEF